MDTGSYIAVEVLFVTLSPYTVQKKILLVKTKLFTKDLTKSPRSVLSRGENGR